MANVHLVQLTFTEDQALAWLRAHGTVTISCTELGKRWNWHRNRVGRRLQSWAAVGAIKRRGKTIQVMQSTALKTAPVQKIRTSAFPKTALMGGAFSKILGIILILAALSMTATLVFVNARAWSAFAKSSEDAWVFVTLALTIDLLAALLPLAAKIMHWRAAIGMWCMWAACMGMILWTSVGFAFGNFGNAVGSREATIDRRAVVQQELIKRRDRLANQPPYAVTIQEQVDAAVDERKRECERGRFCTRARREEARLTSSLSLTKEAKELSDSIDALEQELKTLPVLASADPQIAGPIEALQRLAGLHVDRDGASAARDVVFALVFSFFPGQLLRWGHGCLRD